MRKKLLAFAAVMVLLIAALCVSSLAAEVVDSGKCGENVTWTLDSDGLLTISGEGEMWDWVWRWSNAPWYKNKNIIKTITISDDITTIGDYAFFGCTSLTSVLIPNSITTIGYNAFDGCASLTTVTIPDSVTTIGGYALSGCTSLTGIHVDANNPNYSSDNKGVLLDKNKSTLIQAPGTITEYSIPDSVTTIGSGAFYNCTSLTSITIPNSVTTIGSSAFSDCTSLTSVTIPDSITAIEYDAFHGCTSLISITIPNSVTTIGSSTFSDCTSLTSVTMPDSITAIEYDAFHGCTSLTNVMIPNSVTKIDDHAFYGCTSLLGIWVDDYNANYSSDSHGVLFNKDQTIMIQAPGGIIEYNIPNSVTSIGRYAFSGCTSLISVTIPDSVTKIDYDAFSDCTSLTSITIPNGVTEIDDSTFSGCTSLISVTIPNSVTEIDNHAFYKCSSLTNITIPDSVKKMSIFSFRECDSLEIITVDEQNKYYSSDANGFLYNKYKTNLMLVPAGTKVSTVIIPDNVTIIGEEGYYPFYAFEGCSSVTRIEVGKNNDNFSSDDYGVLYNKDKTEILKVPEGMRGDYIIPLTVTELDHSYIFTNCGLLENIYIHENCDMLEYRVYLFDDCFNDCSSLQGIWVDENHPKYRSDENGVLYSKDMTELIKVPNGKKGDFYVPESVTSVGYRGFSGCSLLNNIYFTGNAPVFLEEIEPESYWATFDVVTHVFDEVTATVYYPDSSEGWIYVIYNGFDSCDLTWVAYTPKPSHPAGDIDGNGQVENSDLVTIARYIVGLTEGDTKSAVEAYADMNSDGKVDNADIVTVARLIVGLA